MSVTRTASGAALGQVNLPVIADNQIIENLLIIQDMMSVNGDMHNRTPDTINLPGNDWFVALASLGNFNTISGYARKTVTIGTWGVSIETGLTNKTVMCDIEIPFADIATGGLNVREVTGANHIGIEVSRLSPTTAEFYIHTSIGGFVDDSAVLPLDGTQLSWDMVVVDNGDSVTAYDALNPEAKITKFFTGWPVTASTPGLRRDTVPTNDSVKWRNFRVLKPSLSDMRLAANQDGDNSENSLYSASSSATPTVNIAPIVQSANGWNWAMLTSDGCTGKAPTFIFPSATFDTGRVFKPSGFPITTPYYSYNQIDWLPFDNKSIDGNGNLVCSNNSAFTGDKVQVALHRPYMWTRMRYFMDTYWGLHPWVFETASSIAEGGTKYVMWTTPADTGLAASRPIPAQEAMGFKIAHPDFILDPRKTLVLTAQMHTGEYQGSEIFVQAVDILLNAALNSPTPELATAYEVLRTYDVYVYPMNNQGSYVSDNQAYEGLLASFYDFGSRWNNTNATVHQPMVDRIEIDISSAADAVLDCQSTRGTLTSESYYQITVNPDDFNGDDEAYWIANGIRKYWYYELMLEIDPTSKRNFANNSGSVRQYSRDNWGCLAAMTLEMAQEGDRTVSESRIAAHAGLHVMRRLAELGRI